MTNKERIEDLLTEFDEFGMKPTILVPDPEEMAKEWKHELEYAIRHLKAEIENLQEVNADLNESLRLAAEANKDLQAEVERLQKYNTDVAFKHCNDGIKEFTDYFERKIDNLVAEMTEGK